MDAAIIRAIINNNRDHTNTFLVHQFGAPCTVSIRMISQNGVQFLNSKILTLQVTVEPIR